jgi:hypothetical protein
MAANTGSQLSRLPIRSIFATGGRGAMRPKRHPAASAWLAIRTKALSPAGVAKGRAGQIEQQQPGRAGDGCVALFD